MKGESRAALLCKCLCPSLASEQRRRIPSIPRRMWNEQTLIGAMAVRAVGSERKERKVCSGQFQRDIQDQSTVPDFPAFKGNHIGSVRSRYDNTGGLHPILPFALACTGIVFDVSPLGRGPMLMWPLDHTW